jgi:hypothetical protein
MYAEFAGFMDGCNNIRAVDQDFGGYATDIQASAAQFALVDECRLEACRFGLECSSQPLARADYNDIIFFYRIAPVSSFFKV